MKNIINKGSILAFILVLACFVSCNDSYLEEKPMDKFSPDLKQLLFLFILTQEMRPICQQMMNR